MTPTINSATAEGAVDLHSHSHKIDAKSQAVSLFFSDMLSQMEEDFEKSGDSIRNRMREMGSKMDGLELSISGLMHDAGLGVEEDGQNEGLNDSKGSAGVDSSSPRRAPTNSSPSHNIDRVQL